MAKMELIDTRQSMLLHTNSELATNRRICTAKLVKCSDIVDSLFPQKNVRS